MLLARACSELSCFALAVRIMNESLGVMDDGLDEDEVARISAAADASCAPSAPPSAAGPESGA